MTDPIKKFIEESNPVSSELSTFLADSQGKTAAHSIILAVILPFIIEKLSQKELSLLQTRIEIYREHTLQSLDLAESSDDVSLNSLLKYFESLIMERVSKLYFNR